MDTSNGSGFRQFSGNEFLGFAEIVDFLHRRWKIIASTAIVVFALTLVTTFLVTPIYSGTTELLLESPRENAMGTDSLTADIVLSSTLVESQLAVLKSGSILRRVVERENLVADPEFGGPEQATWYSDLTEFIRSQLKAVFGMGDSQPRDPIEVAVGMLDEVLSLSRIGQSNAIAITVSSSNPRKAAKLANSLAAAYLTDQLDSRYASATRALDWLNGRSRLLQKEVNRSDAAVQEFKIKHNLLTTGSLTEQNLSELNAALIKARAETIIKRSSLDQVQKLVANGGNVETNPDILRSGIVSDLLAKLNAIRSTERELKSRYNEHHPEVLKIEGERLVLEEQLKKEIEQAIQSLRSDWEAAEQREAALAQSLSSVSGQSATDNQVSVQLRELERMADVNRQTYESFLARSKIAAEEATLPIAEARIISSAALPDTPDFPRKKLFGALGLIMGLFLGTGLAIILELLRPGFMASQQIQDALNLPVLTSVPRIKSWEKQSTGPFTRLIEDLAQKPFARYTEAIRSLRFGIDANSLSENARPVVILVTSTMPGEGKSTLATSLARSCAMAGERVLLIDADLRLRATSTVFRARNEAGLVDVLTSAAGFDDAVFFDDLSGLYVMPVGARSINPPSLLDTVNMKGLIEHARNCFDRVIIDSPPVAVAVDAAILSRYSESVVIAVKWNGTAREAVFQAVRQLSANCRIAGVALTMVDERKLPRFGRYLSFDGKAVESYGHTADWH